MVENQDTERCRTCGAPISRAPVMDPDEGVLVTPPPFCSLHCEHYEGLQRASVLAHADGA